MGEARNRVLIVWAHLETLYRRLSGNVIREICDYLHDKKALVALEGKSVLTFNIETLTWQLLFQLPSPIPLKTASLLYLDDQQIFASGGSEDSCEKSTSLAFLLSPECMGRVGSMARARQGHALLQDSEKVLVFGGASGLAVDSELKVYEEYNLQGKRWKLGAEMIHARAFFTVCRYSCTVYLCGGGTRTVESFNLLACSFTQLPFQLSEESSCLAAVQGCRLTVLTQTNLQVWDLREGQRVSSKKRPFGAVWSVCTPVIRAKVAYLVDFGICKAINLCTGIIVNETST